MRNTIDQESLLLILSSWSALNRALRDAVIDSGALIALSDLNSPNEFTVARDAAQIDINQLAVNIINCRLSAGKVIKLLQRNPMVITYLTQYGYIHYDNWVNVPDKFIIAMRKYSGSDYKVIARYVEHHDCQLNWDKISPDLIVKAYIGRFIAFQFVELELQKLDIPSWLIANHKACYLQMKGEGKYTFVGHDDLQIMVYNKI